MTKAGKLLKLIARCLVINIFALNIIHADLVNNNSATRGWWFYQQLTNRDKKPLDVDCQNPNQWIVACGFIETRNYQFEQKQYHQLLNNFAMNPNDLNAVQRF